VIALLNKQRQRIQDRRNPGPGVRGNQSGLAQRADGLLGDGIDLHALDAISPTQIYGVKRPISSHDTPVMSRDSLSGDVW